MSRLFIRLGIGTAATMATVALIAAPAAATTTIGTTTTAKASSTHVKPGKTFTISGAVRHNTTNLCGQTVRLYERSSSKAKWTKATNTPKATKVTAKAAGAKTCTYTFSVTGLKHGEQYEVVHPAQTIGTKHYGRSVSKVITVSKA